MWLCHAFREFPSGVVCSYDFRLISNRHPWKIRVLEYPIGKYVFLGLSRVIWVRDHGRMRSYILFWHWYDRWGRCCPRHDGSPQLAFPNATHLRKDFNGNAIQTWAPQEPKDHLSVQTRHYPIRPLVAYTPQSLQKWKLIVYPRWWPSTVHNQSAWCVPSPSPANFLAWATDRPRQIYAGCQCRLRFQPLLPWLVPMGMVFLFCVGKNRVRP